MKKIVIFLLIFFSLSVYSQFGRYASTSETGSAPREEQVNYLTEENVNFQTTDFKTLMNLFISYNLSGMEIAGEGKSTTMLTLDISQEGTLTKVSAIGSNNSLNQALQRIFLESTGKKIAKLPVRNPRQIHIPITLQH